MNRPDLRVMCLSVALTPVLILVAQALAGGLPSPQKIDADWRGVLVDPAADIERIELRAPRFARS